MHNETPGSEVKETVTKMIPEDKKEKYKKIRELIDRAESVAFLVHVNMDADAFGSAIALGSYVKSLGKSAKIFGQKTRPPYLFFFEDKGMYDPDTKDAEYDLVIAVDCGNLSRFEDRSEIFNKAKATVVMDHHASESDIVPDVAVVDPDAAATAVLVWEFMRSNGIGITDDYALNMFYALSRDTGGFRHGNTDTRAFLCAADLMTTGIDITKMTNDLFYAKSFAEQKLRGIGLDRMEVLFDGKVAISYIRYEDYNVTGATQDDAETIVDFGREILGVDISVMLRETAGGDVRVNLRSKEFNVARIAERFNGGGHEHAAGCSIDEDILKAKQMIIDCIKEFWN